MLYTTRYNPFTAAASAAYAELTSDAAKTFYTRTAINTAINTLEFTVDAAEGWYMAANLAIQLGAMARAWFNAHFTTTIEPAFPVALPPAPCAGLLPEISSAVRPVLTTPAPITAEVVTEPAPTPLANRIRANVAASRRTTAEILATTAEAIEVAEATTTAAYSTLGIRELRRLCADRGIPKATRLSKAAAIAALTA